MIKRGDKKPNNLFNGINIFFSSLILILILFAAMNKNVLCCSETGCSEIQSIHECSADQNQYVKYDFSSGFSEGNLTSSGFYFFSSILFLSSLNIGYFIILVFRKKYNINLGTSALGILMIYLIFSKESLIEMGLGIPSLLLKTVMLLIPPALLLFLSIISYKQNRFSKK